MLDLYSTFQLPTDTFEIYGEHTRYVCCNGTPEFEPWEKLPRRLTITQFPSAKAQSKKELQLTLAKLAELIRSTDAKSKDKLPWLKMATFGEKRTDRNCLRHNENVTAIDGVEADYDAGKIKFKDAAKIVRKAGLTAVIYTSASHTDAAPRWRILLPTSEMLPPSERTKLMARLNGVYGGAFSGESFTLSQSYYFGSVNNNPAHQVQVVEGDYIDQRDDLDAIALDKNGKKWKGGNGGDTSAEYSETPDEFVKAGRELQWAFKEVEAALWAIPNDETIDRRKWIDIGHAIKSTYPKEGRPLFNDWSATWVMWRDLKEYREKGEAYTLKKYDSFKPRDIDPRFLFNLANEASPGWREAFKQKEEAKSESKPNGGLVLVCAADVVMRPQEWLWEGHLLRGSLELLTGLPALGKSQTQIHFMACATARLMWPDGAPAIEPCNVIMCTAEDNLDTVVVPRLKAAGADLKRVHIIKCIRTDKRQRQFLLAEDLTQLAQTVAQVGDVGLICIDPITAYMGGKVDAHKTTEVRSQLGPLKDFAEGINVAVSAITHPAKNAGARAIDHFIGSQAFIAAARVGHACIEEFETDEETKEKYATGRVLFTHVKPSSHRRMPTLAFKIEEVEIAGSDPFTTIKTARVVWDKGAVDISADQAVAASRSMAKAAKQDEASSELLNLLRTMLDAGKGYAKQTEIAAQVKALGYSDKELRTARDKLKIVSIRKGGLGDDGWWELSWKDGKRPKVMFD